LTQHVPIHRPREKITPRRSSYCHSVGISGLKSPRSWIFHTSGRHSRLHIGGHAHRFPKLGATMHNAMADQMTKSTSFAWLTIVAGFSHSMERSPLSGLTESFRNLLAKSSSKSADQIRLGLSSACRKCLSLRHAPGRVRTANLQFRRLSLYPVELRVLSLADDDNMARPGFGKAKIRALGQSEAETRPSPPCSCFIGRVVRKRW
jgi:hypothetical protein